MKMNILYKNVNVDIENLKTFVRDVVPYLYNIYIIYIYLYILMFTTFTTRHNARRCWVKTCCRCVAVAFF